MGFLLLVVTGSPGQAGSGAFSHELPAAIGDISGWQLITGEFENDAATGSYRFYVNPRRQAIYQVMRYRVELRGGDSAREHGSAERVAFVRQPGSRTPMLCWLLEPGLSGVAWRQLQPGTDEYKMEMATLMQVLAIHRSARVSPAP